VPDDVLKFRLGQPHVEREERRADAVHRERALQELRAVAHQQRHDVALADAGLNERGRERVHPVKQLPVGEPGRAEDHRVLVRGTVRVAVEGPGEVEHDHLLRRLLGIERHSSE
jgi:hypothetical protein